MEGARCWSVEAKVFEVLIKGGDSGVRIFERSKKKKCSIFVRRDEIVWLVGALEEVAEAGKSKVFWDQSRAGFPRLITQKRSNRHGRFLSIEEFDGRRRSGSILVPEGRYGQGWARLMVELDGANSSIWEGRENMDCLSDPVAEKPSGLEAKSTAATPLVCKATRRNLITGRDREVEAQVAPVYQKNPEAALVCGSSATAPMKSFNQAGGAPGAGVPGDALCGGEGMTGLLEDASSKGRWVQALLSPAPLSVNEACLPRQGMESSLEEFVSKGVSSFNAKMELLFCRDWLKRIRGEVDAGLRRLDMVLKEVDFSGPGQERPDSELAPKPIRKPEPKDKMKLNPKAPSMGLGCSGPGQGRLDFVLASKPIRKPEPKDKKNLLPKAPSVGLGLGPKVGINFGQARRFSFEASSGVGQGLVVGLSGHSKGSRGEGGSTVGLSAKAGPEDSLGVVPSKEAGVSGHGVGRTSMGDAIRVGSPAPASSSRLGEPGPGLRPEMAGLEDDECSVSSSKWGVSGSALVSPAPEYLGLKSPICLSLGRRAVSTEPSKLQVYQRSRWRNSKPLRSVGPPCSSGQLKSRGLLGPISSVSPVRLAFDGCDVASRESEFVPPSVVTLGSAPNSDEVVGSAPNSVEVVPESMTGEVSAGSGMAGVNSVVAEKLDRAMAVGEVAGLTSEGQPGLLKEFLGQIVVENHGRRGSHVINES
jgi:hypothetical protein